MTSISMEKFYHHVEQIYNDPHLNDTDRRTRVYNMCILQWQTDARNNEPKASTLNSDGTFKPNAFDRYRNSALSTDINVIRKRWSALSTEERQAYEE